MLHANSPTKLAINSATNMVCMLCSDGIYIIDGSSNSLKQLKTGKSQSARSGLDLNPVTNTIYTTSLSVGVLTVIDAVNGSTISEVNIGKPLAGVAVDISENKVYILSPKTVHVIDAHTNQQVEEIKTSVEHKLSMSDSPNELDYVLVNPSSKLLYIQQKNMTGYDTTSNESFDLLVIDMTEKVRLNKRQLHTRPTPAGLYQHGAVFNSSNNALYTIDPNRNRLLKFDSMAKRLIETKYLSEPIAWWKRILSTGMSRTMTKSPRPTK